MPKIITLTQSSGYNFPGFGGLKTGQNEVPDDVVAVAMKSRSVLKAVNAGILQIGHGQAAMEIDSTAVDLDALRELAAGDGRRKDVQEARAQLAEIEGAE
jgi:hypothetical protein